MKPDKLTKTDVHKLKYRIVVEALLELDQFGQLSPQTISELQKMKRFKCYKKSIFSKSTEDKIQSFDDSGV